MSDNERQENFAARLQRIEARQNSEPLAMSDAAPPKEQSRFDDPPEENVFVRNALIWLAITVVAVVGGFYGIKAMPQDLKNTIAWIAGKETTPTKSVSAPPATVIVETDTMSDQGPTLGSPSVALATQIQTNLSAVATNVFLPTPDTQIGQIIPFDSNANCTLRPPLGSETVVNIRVESGLLPAPVQAFSADALSRQLLQNVTAVTQMGQAYATDAQINGTMSTVDVFLTDTTAPLYLVLQNIGDGIIWNIHAAPDVTVAHVAIVSAQISGLVNIADTTTFDALLVGDDDCAILPWRHPQPEWIGMQKAAAGDTDMRTQMQSYADGFANYDTWFKDTLGIDASSDVVSLRDVAHVLHGDVPADSINYQTIQGQDIHMMRTEHIITGDAQARADTVKALHQQTLLAAVGGAIDMLNPAPVERANP